MERLEAKSWDIQATPVSHRKEKVDQSFRYKDVTSFSGKAFFNRSRDFIQIASFNKIQQSSET